MAQKCSQAQQLKEDERRAGMAARALIGPGRHKQAEPHRKDFMAAASTAKVYPVYLWPISDNKHTKEKLGFANKDFPENMLFYGMFTFSLDHSSS